MTARSSRRVVIINNIKSERIEQAIFILKGDMGVKPDRFVVREAQEIIDNYIKRVRGESSFCKTPDIVLEKKKKPRYGFITGAIAVTLITAIFLMKYFGA